MATTHGPVDCTRAAISAEISDAGTLDGDTVLVSAGTATDWTTELEITKAIHLQGAGVGQSIIQDSVPNDDAVIYWNVAAGKTWEMSGFEFHPVTADSTATSLDFADANPDTVTRSSGSFVTDGFAVGMKLAITSAQTSANNGTYTILTVTALVITIEEESSESSEFTADTGDTTAALHGYYSSSRGVILVENDATIKLHDCKWIAGHSKRTCQIQKTAATGVIYNNTILQEAGDSAGFYVRHENWAGGTNGDGSWSSPVNWGSDEFIFFEDNTWTYATGVSNTILDGNGGSRAVVRNNTITNAWVIWHGNDSSNQQRGGRAGEVYDNIANWSDGAKNGFVIARSGSWLVHGNTLGGSPGYTDTIVYDHYKADESFRLWHHSNFRSAWEKIDGSVLDSGTSTGGTTTTITDTGQSWDATGNGEWEDHHIAMFAGFTLTGVSGDDLTVSGAGWTTDEWARWEVVRDSDGRRWRVLSNTSDTLTLHGTPYPTHDIVNGTAITLERAGYIESNTATVITCRTDNGNTDGAPADFKSGLSYEIGLVLESTDCTGSGQSGAMVAPRVSQDLYPSGWVHDASYVWDNTFNSFNKNVYYILEGKHFASMGTSKPGYTPYVYPHPLRGSGKARQPSRTRTLGLL